MARFIDAENLNYLMCSIYWGEDEEGNEVYRRTEVAFRTDIEQIPTADVVEVVRCAGCKHLEVINNAPIYAKCKKHGIVFELWQEDTREHYCSWGERRKDDDVL